jgi:hypothetical protein
MLEKLKQAVIDNGNVFAVQMDAMRNCSLGQISSALYEVGGQYRRSMEGNTQRVNGNPDPKGWRRKNDEVLTLPFSLSGYGEPENAGNFESFCFPNRRWNQVVSSSFQTGRRRFARFLLLLRLFGASQNPLDQDFHVGILDVGVRRHRDLTPDTTLRPGLDLGGQRLGCILVAGILLGHIDIRGADQFFIDRVAGHAIALLGEFQIRLSGGSGHQAGGNQDGCDMFHGLPFIGWGKFARGFGYGPHERIRGTWHGRAGEVGSSIVGVRGLSNAQGGRPAIPPVRFLEQRPAGRSRSWHSCAPNRWFNRIGHDVWVVKNIPQLYARNAPDTAIRFYVSVLYGLAMSVEGARQIQCLP